MFWLGRIFTAFHHNSFYSKKKFLLSYFPLCNLTFVSFFWMISSSSFVYTEENFAIVDFVHTNFKITTRVTVQFWKPFGFFLHFIVIMRRKSLFKFFSLKRILIPFLGQTEGRNQIRNGDWYSKNILLRRTGTKSLIGWNFKMRRKQMTVRKMWCCDRWFFVKLFCFSYLMQR